MTVGGQQLESSDFVVTYRKYNTSVIVRNDGPHSSGGGWLRTKTTTLTQVVEKKQQELYTFYVPASQDINLTFLGSSSQPNAVYIRSNGDVTLGGNVIVGNGKTVRIEAVSSSKSTSITTRGEVGILARDPNGQIQPGTASVNVEAYALGGSIQLNVMGSAGYTRRGAQRYPADLFLRGRHQLPGHAAEGGLVGRDRLYRGSQRHLRARLGRQRHRGAGQSRRAERRLWRHRLGRQGAVHPCAPGLRGPGRTGRRRGRRRQEHLHRAERGQRRPGAGQAGELGQSAGLGVLAAGQRQHHAQRRFAAGRREGRYPHRDREGLSHGHGQDPGGSERADRAVRRLLVGRAGIAGGQHHAGRRRDLPEHPARRRWALPPWLSSAPATTRPC